MDWRDRIIVDPGVLAGKPVIRGTRLAVDFVVELLAEEWTREEILSNYPQLSSDDVQAALSYAAETLRSEKVYPLSVQPQ